MTASAAFANTDATFHLTNTTASTPVTTTPTAATSILAGPTTTTGAVLPATGAHGDVERIALLGIGLVMVGAAALGASRRRKVSTRSRPS